MRQTILSSTEIITTTTSSVIPLKYVESFSIQASSTVTTPAAFNFEDADVHVVNNTIAEAAHGLTTGLKCQLTTTGVLPAGLSLATDYFVIASTSSLIKLASSLVNAQAGTAVDITAAAGTGTHTLTATAIAGGVVKVQGSNDQSNWSDITSATANITATGVSLINVVDAGYKWARAHVTLTAGRINCAIIAAGKELS